MAVINRTPYRNLILTGPMGVGKTGVGRRIQQQMEGSQFFDLEIEIQNREGYSAEQIRATFGLARLRSLENQLVEEMTLRRSCIIAVNGFTLLDPSNLERLRETGPILCLTAALGEILRRVHVTEGGRFHDPNYRAVVVGRLKREGEIARTGLPVLDTTALKMEEVAQRAKTFWLNESDF
jgi:shikimate kinase